MFKRWPIFAWRKAGDSRQDSTLVYSEMPGGLKITMPKRHYKNAQHEKAMKADVRDPSDAIRKAGW